MKCPTCGGIVKPGITNLPIELETGLLYIKHVPVDIFEQCDDVFIPDNITAKIEGIVDAAKKQKVEVEVIDFQGAAWLHIFSILSTRLASSSSNSRPE